MHYHPDKATIGSLLSITNPPLVVPDWQRNYSWTTREVETFWNDILHFDEVYPGNNADDQEYFLGSVVIVDQTTSHLLLDGQQRLATSAIMLSVIRDFLARYSKDAAIRTQSRYLSDFDDSTNQQLYKMTLNIYDRQYFKRLILERREDNYIEPEAEIESHSLIRNSRTFFEQQFEEQFAQSEDLKANHQWCLRMQNLLTRHLSVVAILTTDQDNAANVFETLNDRGIGLSTPDLLRNLVLRRAHEHQIEEIVGLWGEILGVENDAKLKTYLRHFWISRYGDIKTQSLYREIKRTIENDNIESLDLSRQLRDESIQYRDIVSGTNDDPTIAEYLADINELGAYILHPILLSLLSRNVDSESIDLIKVLIAVFVRHSVIAGLENSKLENVLYLAAREIREGKNTNEVITTLKDFAPGDVRFKSAFASASITRRATQRYILRQLEQSLRQTEELDVAPPHRVHVEHIYPQTPREGQRFDQHSRWIDRIGNLTPLSRRLNVSIGNAPFSEKKEKYKESELLLTKQLLDYQNWTTSEIEARQADMTERVCQIWPL